MGEKLKQPEYWQADASNKAGLIVDHKADPCLVQAFRVIQ